MNYLILGVGVFFVQSVFAQQKLASSIQNVDSARMSIRESKIVEKMPPPYSSESEGINFCYAFAGGTLVEQMLGRRNLFSEKVSMLDLAIYGQGLTEEDLRSPRPLNPAPYLDDLGNIYRSLVYLSLKRAVARESCVPFDSFPILKSSGNQNVEYAKALVTDFAEGHRYALEGDFKRQFEVAERIKETQKLKVSVSTIAEALKLDHFQKFAGALFVPQSCQDTRLKLPAFDVALYRVDGKSFERVPQLLVESINSNKPMIWAFCLSSSCDRQHVVVIFGYRRICENGESTSCFVQFLVRDSGREVSDRSGDYWVDESVILDQYRAIFSLKKDQRDENIPLPDELIAIQEIQ